MHTKDDVPCSEVDKLGNVKKDSTIPEDSYILFMYSDGDSYVDVRVIDKEYVDELSWEDEEYKYYTIKDFSLLDYDGDCYRITIEFEDGHFGGTVDGVTIDKLFEGMRYSA